MPPVIRLNPDAVSVSSQRDLGDFGIIEKDRSTVLNPHLVLINITPEQRRRIEKVLAHFPELEDETLVFRRNPDLYPLGRYCMDSRSIVFRKETPTYHTLGHEVVHALHDIRREIPGSERATDLYTFARAELFCDDPGAYLNVPGRMDMFLNKGDERWRIVQPHVHRVAREALREREEGRHDYLRWFELRLKAIVEEVLG